MSSPCHFLVRSRGDSDKDDRAYVALSYCKVEVGRDGESSGWGLGSNWTREAIAKRTRNAEENQEEVRAAVIFGRSRFTPLEFEALATYLLEKK